VGATYQLSLGPVTWLMPVGSSTGGTAAEDDCPAGRWATGNPLRSSVWIDAYSLDCAAPTLVP
jgi:hypothetical protein